MPVGVTVDVVVKRGLDPELLQPAMVLGMERALAALAPDVRGAITPHRLASVLRFIVDDREPGIVVGRIGLSPIRRAMVARFMETGTAGHPIEPRATLTLRQVTDERIVATQSRGKPLRFKIGDRWISTYRVEHPGMAARPWLQPSLDAGGERIAEAIGSAVELAYAEPSNG